MGEGRHTTCEGAASGICESPAEASARAGLRDPDPRASAAEVRAWASSLLALSPTAETVDRILGRWAPAPVGGDAVLTSALLHARGRLSGRAEDLVTGLHHARSATLVDSTDAPAWFNRALLETELGLCRQARASWERAVLLEKEGGWSDEIRARARHAPCSDPLPEALPDVEDLLGDELAAALLDGRASPAWAELRRRASLLEDATGDPFVSEFLSGVERLDTPDVEAIQRYATLRAEARNTGDAALVDVLASLAGDLDDLPHIQYVTAMDRGMLLVYAARYERAAESLAPLEAAPSAYLRGRRLWLLALAQVRAGDRDTAIVSARAAREELRPYPQAAGAVGSLLSEMLTLGGRTGEGWRERVSTTHALQSRRPTFFLGNALIVGAREAERSGAPRAAYAFLEEAEGVAMETGDTIGLVEARLRRGDVLAATGQDARAAELYASTAELAATLPPGGTRERVLANATVGLASLADADPPAAFPSALAYFEARGPEFRIVQARTAQARALWRQGRQADARAAFDAAIAALRPPPAGDWLAGDYWRSVQKLFDEAIGLEMREGSPERGAHLLATSRRWNPVIGGGPSVPLRTPPTKELWFADVGGVAYRWTLTPDSVTGGRIGEADLISRVRSFSGSVRNGRLPEEEAERLHSLLLETHTEDQRYVLAADGVFASLPFAALVDPSTKLPLGATRQLSFRSPLGRGRGGGGSRSGPPLVVGDPGPDRPGRVWPPPLPGATEEARAISALYGDAVLLEQEGADLQAVRIGLSNTRLFHFAGHARADSLGRPSLFLAGHEGPEPVPADSLLAGLDLRGMEMVVLSACESGGAAGDRALGVIGPSWPFLSAGVPTVVGTLWPVQDDAMVTLMEAFHRASRAGSVPEEALRSATARVLETDPEACCAWASLQIVQAPR